MTDFYTLTFYQYGVRWLTPRPGRFTPRKRPGASCLGGWVGLRADLDVWGKFRPHRDSIPGLSIP
jgi:hypothetical protein